VQREATRSRSVTCSSTWKLKSGKSFRYNATDWRAPSVPRYSSALTWSTKRSLYTSSTAARSLPEHTSSSARRAVSRCATATASSVSCLDTVPRAFTLQSVVRKTLQDGEGDAQRERRPRAARARGAEQRRHGCADRAVRFEVPARHVRSRLQPGCIRGARGNPALPRRGARRLGELCLGARGAHRRGLQRRRPASLQW